MNKLNVKYACIPMYNTAKVVNEYETSLHKDMKWSDQNSAQRAKNQ